MNIHRIYLFGDSRLSQLPIDSDSIVISGTDMDNGNQLGLNDDYGFMDNDGVAEMSSEFNENSNESWTSSTVNKIIANMNHVLGYK